MTTDLHSNHGKNSSVLGPDTCQACRMYVPAHFQAPDGALGELLARAPLADLITYGARADGTTGMLATPLPLLHDADQGPRGALVGHVARNNPHWRLGAPAPDRDLSGVPGAGGPGADLDGAAPDSLVILRGPDAYISPTWYASTAEHGRVVPTWNYLTAHVHGRLVVHDDADWTLRVVRRLTEHFEAGFLPPWTVDDPPAEFLSGQLRAIVGIEIVITSIEAKYKLGQNRSDADVAGAVTGLDGGTPADRALAEQMRTARRRRADR
jgi:transcriptional regulator